MSEFSLGPTAVSDPFALAPEDVETIARTVNLRPESEDASLSHMATERPVLFSLMSTMVEAQVPFLQNDYIRGMAAAHSFVENATQAGLLDVGDEPRTTASTFEELTDAAVSMYGGSETVQRKNRERVPSSTDMIAGNTFVYEMYDANPSIANAALQWSCRIAHRPLAIGEALMDRGKVRHVTAIGDIDPKNVPSDLRDYARSELTIYGFMDGFSMCLFTLSRGQINRRFSEITG